MRKQRFVACICNNRPDAECEAVVHLTVAGKLQLELTFASIHHQLMVDEHARGFEELGETGYERVVSACMDHYHDRARLEQQLDDHYGHSGWEDLDLWEMFPEI